MEGKRKNENENENEHEMGRKKKKKKKKKKTMGAKTPEVQRLRCHSAVKWSSLAEPNDLGGKAAKIAHEHSYLFARHLDFAKILFSCSSE